MQTLQQKTHFYSTIERKLGYMSVQSIVQSWWWTRMRRILDSKIKTQEIEDEGWIKNNNKVNLPAVDLKLAYPWLQQRLPNNSSVERENERGEQWVGRGPSVE